jgi:hypothetical protein
MFVMYLLTRSISGSEELSVIKTVSERVIIGKDTLFIGFTALTGFMNKVITLACHSLSMS